MSMTSITHLDNEHNDWLRALDFYKQECGILKERLTEVAGKNTGDEVGRMSEQFESRLTVQITNIDTLRHNINENLHHISEQAKNSAGHVDTQYLEQHAQLREQFIAEEKQIAELRHEFNRFAAKWM